MEIIKVGKNAVFILETDGTLSDREQEAILTRWHDTMPNHKLLIIKRNSIKILETTDASDPTSA
jgi:hypothetical protein